MLFYSEQNNLKTADTYKYETLWQEIYYSASCTRFNVTIGYFISDASYLYFSPQETNLHNHKNKTLNKLGQS
jgi:hypothetical protein